MSNGLRLVVTTESPEQQIARLLREIADAKAEIELLTADLEAEKATLRAVREEIDRWAAQS